MHDLFGLTLPYWLTPPYWFTGAGFVFGLVLPLAVYRREQLTWAEIMGSALILNLPMITWQLLSLANLELNIPIVLLGISVYFGLGGFGIGWLVGLALMLATKAYQSHKS
jgi:hypothetical protein